MQHQAQFIFQEIADDGHQLHQLGFVGADNVEVVDIAAIMFHPQGPFDEVVEFRQVNVAEKLRRQVADGQAAAVGRVEQALRAGQSDPLALRAAHFAVLGRVVEHDFAGQIAHQIVVEILFPGLAVESTAFGKAVEFLHDNIEKYLPVDVHEIALYVKFQQVAFPLEVVRARADVVFQARNAEMGAHALAAGVAVGDEGAFEKRGYIVAQQVVHHTVAEIGREDFAFDRYVGHEAYAAAHLVAAFVDLVEEFDQIGFEVHLETQLAEGVPLVFAGIVVGPENISQKFFVHRVSLNN